MGVDTAVPQINILSAPQVNDYTSTYLCSLIFPIVLTVHYTCYMPYLPSISGEEPIYIDTPPDFSAYAVADDVYQTVDNLWLYYIVPFLKQKCTDKCLEPQAVYDAFCRWLFVDAVLYTRYSNLFMFVVQILRGELGILNPAPSIARAVDTCNTILLQLSTKLSEVNAGSFCEQLRL
jgi:hypothetical protein